MSVLRFTDVTKRYSKNRTSFDALRSCSLAVEAGGFLTVLGPNGAGKSTILRCAIGLVRPDAGTVRILGRDPIVSRGVLSGVGSVLEGGRALHWRLTVEENLAYCAALKGYSVRSLKKRVDDLLEAIGLSAQRSVVVGKLSRGMQQRLSFIAAMIHEPRLLLLDEPSLGLDAASVDALKSLLRLQTAAGVAVVLTTHHLELAADLSDEIILLSDGRRIDCGPSKDIARHYADDAYVIETVSAVPQALSEKMMTGGFFLEDPKRIVVRGGTAALYECLSMLRPTPIAKIERSKRPSDSVPASAAVEERSHAYA